MEERAEPWSTLALVLNNREIKPFQVYVVDLLKWQLLKNLTILLFKLVFLKHKERNE